jgi:hypothetical protein
LKFCTEVVSKFCGFACDGIIIFGVVMARISIEAVILPLLIFLLAEKGKIANNHLRISMEIGMTVC